MGYEDVWQWTEVPGVDKLHENLMHRIQSIRRPSHCLVVRFNTSMFSLDSTKLSTRVMDTLISIMIVGVVSKAPVMRCRHLFWSWFKEGFVHCMVPAEGEAICSNLSRRRITMKGSSE